MREARSRDCCRGCLRGSLRALNYLLAILGVLMVAYALFMYVQWSEATPDSPSQPDGPAPDPADHSLASLHGQFDVSSADTFHSDYEPLDQELSIVDEATGELVVGQSADAFLADVDAGESTREDEWQDEIPEGDDHTGGNLGKYPWFIYVFGGAGLFVFVTASVGILSADCAGCGVTCLLGLYHALMVVLLLIQVSVVLFYFLDRSWEQDLPPDKTGEYAKMRDIVMHNLRACQLCGLAALGLQLLALLVSCSLYYAESRPRLEYRVLQQLEYDNTSQASFALAGAGASSQAPRASHPGVPAGSGDVWNRRMQEKYPAGGGIDTAALGYDPEAARGLARGDDDVAERSGGRCVVM